MNARMTAINQARTPQPVGPAAAGSFPEGIVGQVQDHEDRLTVFEKKVEGCHERLKDLQDTVEGNHQCDMEGAEASSPKAPCFTSAEAYGFHAPEVQNLRPPLHEHHHDPRAYVAPSPHPYAHAHDTFMAHVTGSEGGTPGHYPPPPVAPKTLVLPTP